MCAKNLSRVIELGRGHSFLNNKLYAQCFSTIKANNFSSDIEVEYHHVFQWYDRKWVS
ncbi:MAG: hypothetical protein HQK50_01075 [Oligoflexia bacterium]|nr:hypothetical protein [Oligoflexia bacterium]